MKRVFSQLLHHEGSATRKIKTVSKGRPPTWAETRGPSLGLYSTHFMLENKWSGRVDLNHRPPGPEPGALARLRYAPTAGTRAR